MSKVKRESVEDILPLTSTQAGVLYHYLREPDSDHYLVQLSLRLRGHINRDNFEQAWAAVSEANEMLRVVFRWEEIQQPVQIVLESRAATITYADFSGFDGDAQRIMLAEFKQTDRKNGIDLKHLPFRVALFNLADDFHELLITYHNIICDGWSVSILVDELLMAYDALARGQRPSIPAKASVKDFFKWRLALNRETAIDYWKQSLHGVEPPVALSVKSVCEAGSSAESACVSETVPDELVQAVLQLSKTRRVTLTTTLYAVWAVLLARYTDSEDVVFGTAVSGRPAGLEGIDRSVGLFINTPPVRVALTAQKTFAEILVQIRDALASRRDHEWLGAVDIHRASGLTSGELLFRNIIAVENYPVTRQSETNQALTIESYSFTEATHYDFTLIVRAFDGLTLDFGYRRDLFDRESARRLCRHYINLLAQCVTQPNMTMAEVEMLDTDERKQIVAAFQGHRCLREPRTVVDLFDEAAANYTDRVALICGARKVAYAELQKRVHAFASQLQQRNVTAGALVGLLMDRSIEMIVAILGILKAGGAYVPLSRNHPARRTEVVLRESGVQVLVLQGILPEGIHFDGTVINVNDELVGTSVDDSLPAPKSDHLAYVIYTSGFTGAPKGVMVSHRALFNLLNWLQRKFQFGPEDTVLQTTAITFDVSIWELFSWMVGGGRLYLPEPGAEKDPAAIIAAVQKHRVTAAHFVPAMLAPFLEYVGVHDDAGRLASLRLAFSSGEPLTGKIAERFWSVLGQNKHIRFFNLYGPTETTVWTSSYECSPQDVGPCIISIGKPIDNGAYYVLGRWGQLQPLGVCGELYITGDCVAAGYLNLPELTAERFRIPFEIDEPAYRTGDIVRGLPDGNVEFRCRRDRQVKIRGHRIEPAEIESSLLEVEGIDRALVTVHNGELWAYYISRKLFNAAELRLMLTKRLPTPMVPEHFVRLEAFPLTASGKIDVKNLPTSQPAQALATKQVESNEHCEKMISVWAEVLALTPQTITPEDNFFSLGGNSVTAVSLISAIYRQLEVSLPLAVVFDNPTPRGLAEAVTHARRTLIQKIPRAELREYYELSYNQKRLWILQQLRPETAAYNLVGSMEFHEALDVGQVGSAINILIQRHDSLRTRFFTVKSAPVQVVHNHCHTPLEVQDLSGLPQVQQNAARQRFLMSESLAPFDLTRAPLVRTTLLKLGQNHYELVVNMPHIISDGWSLELLKDEFARLFRSGGTDQTSPPSLQYKDYVVWQNRLLRDENALAEVREFWKSLLDPAPARLNLPDDFTGSHNSRKSAAFRIVVSSELTQRLRNWAQRRRIGLFLPLAAALQLTMAQITGQDDILIGFVAAARKHESLHPVIGMFANSLMLRSKIDRNQTVVKFLDVLQSQLLQALEYQCFPIELISEKLRLNCPQPSVFLNLLNIGSDYRIALTDFESSHIPEIQESKFPLHYCVKEFSNGIEIVCDYYAERFSPRTIERKMELYIHYLNRIVEASDETVRETSHVMHSQRLNRTPVYAQV